MSEPITEVTKAVRMIGILTANVDLVEVSETVADWILQHPSEAGQQFTAFLRNGARMVLGTLITIINRAKKFNLTEFFGEGWAIWRGLADGQGLEGDEEQDARSLALFQVDWGQVSFETCLKENETSITGHEKLKRLVASGKTCLDAGVGETLWLDYKANGDNSVLERLRREKGITYLDFFGTILRDSGGNRCVLYFGWSGTEWDWRVYWLGFDWRADHTSPVLV